MDVPGRSSLCAGKIKWLLHMSYCINPNGNATDMKGNAVRNLLTWSMEARPTPPASDSSTNETDASTAMKKIVSTLSQRPLLSVSLETLHLRLFLVHVLCVLLRLYHLTTITTLLEQSQK